MNKYFSSSDEVFEWLSKFINLERGQKPKSFLLDRMITLLELANRPDKCAPSIHIAGSKGKGSVTSMLSAMLTAAGFKTARYMSPHVINIRERICLDAQYFDEEIYRSAGDELRHIVDVLLPAAANPLFDTNNDGCEPTFWELLTMLFFLCARKGKCDVMAVETGMGGRLDSTNVLDPLVSVITLIELEHTSILGDTITAIAGEKAGIIKKGRPLILAKQNEDAYKIFKKISEEKNSELFYFPEIAKLSDIKISSQGTEFSLSINNPSFKIKDLSFSIPIPGKVQAENAALAIAALKIAFPQMENNANSVCAIKKGLANLKIPGRFEMITPALKQPFIIDGAHTPESLALCIETFCSLYGEGGILLFGCAADKDSAAMAKITHSHFAKIIITTPGTFKTSNPLKVYETFVKTAGQEKTELVKDTQEAIKRAQKAAEAQNQEGKMLPILGTGSFYLVAEIRRFIINE
ncbi:MAG: Mur ligase family protein [Treponema sp.]|nr:Mur ligase family protein [Treponema sp.]MCL2251598.1 Mur ligase family protein [Treponema sp.]